MVLWRMSSIEGRPRTHFEIKLCYSWSYICLVEDNADPQKADFVDDYLKNEEIARMVGRPTLTPLKIFGMPLTNRAVSVLHHKTALLEE
ncbi:hypothetical protein TNCV_990511 [Trichonephila clavipes]|nr:hypothetical protein TNCV_990511 [Trichonephila clavipes]